MATAEEIKEEFITQQIKAWLANAVEISALDVAAKLASMATETSFFVQLGDMGAQGTTDAYHEQGMAIPQPGDKYLFIPFGGVLQDSILLQRRSQLLAWAANPANRGMLVDVHGLVEKECTEACSLEIVDNASIPNLDFQTKIKLCAKSRLMKHGCFGESPLEVSTTFRFCVCDADRRGTITIDREYTEWDTSYVDFISKLEHSRAPDFTQSQIMELQHKHLSFVLFRNSVQDEIEAIKCTIEQERWRPADPPNSWDFFVSDGNLATVGNLGAVRVWLPLRSEDKYREMLDAAKAASRSHRSLVFIRPWQRRLYEIWCEIKALEERQSEKHWQQHRLFDDKDGPWELEENLMTGV